MRVTVLALVVMCALSSCLPYTGSIGSYGVRSYRVIGTGLPQPARAADAAHQALAIELLQDRWSTFGLYSSERSERLNLASGSYYSALKAVDEVYYDGFPIPVGVPLDTLTITDGTAEWELTAQESTDVMSLSVIGSFDVDAAQQVLKQLHKAPYSGFEPMRSAQTFQVEWTISGSDGGASFEAHFAQEYHMERIAYSQNI